MVAKYFIDLLRIFCLLSYFSKKTNIGGNPAEPVMQIANNLLALEKMAFLLQFAHGVVLQKIPAHRAFAMIIGKHADKICGNKQKIIVHECRERRMHHQDGRLRREER